MVKKEFILVSILILSLTVACSGQVASVLGRYSSSTTSNPISDTSQMTLKAKLGIGILSLDGTDLSVSTDQAAILLPLWQAVLSLGADKNVASEEIAALYTQIADTLTMDQIAQIEKLSWSQDDLANLTQEVQFLSNQAVSDAKSTSSSTSSQGLTMGGGPGGDMLPPDGGIMMNGGGAGMGVGQNTTGETQQSLIASQISSKSTVELNVLVAPAVIDLLQRQVNF